MQASITNSATRYGWGAIILHWLIALIFIGQFGLGFIMVRLTSQRTAFELIQLHKSFGFLLLGLVVLRIAWRLGNVLPALPRSVGALERRAAPLAHLALYAFQLALPLSGWALVSVSMLEIPSLPNRMAPKASGLRRIGISPMPASPWSCCMPRRHCGTISNSGMACSRA
jgi:cytochrome b561